MTAEDNAYFPTELRLNKEKTQLLVTFNTGQSFDFSAEFLRVYSPSAEVKGHGSEPRKIVPGKKNVHIIDINMVGNYAVKLIFDDGHDTGLYSWTYLYELGTDFPNLWAEYLSALEQNGGSR